MEVTEPWQLLNSWCLHPRSSWNGKECVYKGSKEVLVFPEAVAVKIHMHIYEWRTLRNSISFVQAKTLFEMPFMLLIMTGDEFYNLMFLAECF